MSVISDDLTVGGHLQAATMAVPANSIVNASLAATAAIARAKLAQDNLKPYPVNFTDLRVWDAFASPLPGSGDIESADAAPSYSWDPNGADDSFFVAIRKFRVVGIRARVEVAGTDAGAVTAVIRKAPSGTDIATGTALHSGSIDLKGTVNTNQTLTLSATSSDLDIAVGDAIGIDFTGVLTAARGAVTVLLAPAGSADDLLLVGGVFATNTPMVKTPDLKAAGAQTLRARFLLRLPAEYVDGETAVLRISGGMQTTVADVTATVDVEAHETDRAGGVGADIVATAAQSINSLTFADKDFTITATSLVAGDILDVRITVAVNDAASVTAVIAALARIEILVDIKG